MPAPLRLPTAALALALVALLACSLLDPAAGAATDGVSGASESTATSDSSTTASDDGNSSASTTEESTTATTATTAADSSESTSSDGSDASSTTTDDSGGSSSDSTTAGSSESSSEDSSTTASDSSTSDSTDGGSNSSTTDESGTSSSDSSTTEESGTNSSSSSTSEESSTSSTNSSTAEESTTSSSNSNTTEESTTSSPNSNTTEDSGTGSSTSSTTEDSGTNSTSSDTTASSEGSSSNSSTTEEPGTSSSNSSTTEESGSNSTSSDTTASSGGSSSNSTTDDGSSSSNGTTNSSSGSDTTTGPGSSSGGNGTNSGSSNSSSAEGGSFHNVSNSGVFLQPGPGEDNYDITKKGEYFNCGGSGNDGYVRLVARYDKAATAEEMTAYLNPASDEYKAEEAMIAEMPSEYQLGDKTVYLAADFTVTLARKVEEAKVEFEISCNVTLQEQAELVAANLSSTEPYSTWSNLRFSKACNMRTNRAVAVAMKFPDETYDAAMRDRSSQAFTSFVASIRLGLLERLRSQVPAVEDVVVLSLSNGSVVAETAVMVDSSGDDGTTGAVHTAAEGTTCVNGKPTQSVKTTQSEDYVAMMDTVNAAVSGNASQSSEDTDLTDDKVPGITTESPNRVVSSDSNGYFLNVTVPSFLALILLIAIFLFCTVNSNSCLCQLCASNVKKEVKLV